MKDQFQHGKAFVFESLVHLFVIGFGMVWVAATFIDKTMSAIQVLGFLNFGFIIAGIGLTRLLDLWWGMDPNKKLLEELDKQQTEIHILREEISSMKNLLERHFDQPKLADQNPSKIEVINHVETNHNRLQIPDL